MEHNPHNFVPGQVVTLDGEFQNGSRVRIIQLSNPNQMFATVRSEEPLYAQAKLVRVILGEVLDLTNAPVGNEWDVMTYRLSPLKQH